LAIAVDRIHWHLLAALAGGGPHPDGAADRTGGKSRNDGWRDTPSKN
jgi:hypothetical protein